MAVVVQCFQCNAVLELDEGFRGGVCRCSGCGTLLQVPRGEVEQTKRKNRPATPGIKPGGSAPRPAPAPDEPGLSRGALQKAVGADETPAAVDAGGSSSSLRQVHPARPITAAERPDAPKPVEATEPQPAASSPDTPPHAPRLEPEIAEVKNNNRLLWTALGLIALVALIVVMSRLILWSKGDDEGGGAGTLPSPQVSTLPGGR